MAGPVLRFSPGNGYINIQFPVLVSTLKTVGLVLDKSVRFAEKILIEFTISEFSFGVKPVAEEAFAPSQEQVSAEEVPVVEQFDNETGSALNTESGADPAHGKTRNKVVAEP